MHRLRQLIANPRVRNETTWVVAHKVAEFIVVLVGLKLFTNLMPEGAYGEYELALTTLGFLACIFETPISQVYVRHYHTAHEDQTARSALAQTMRWMGVSTVLVALVFILLTRPMGALFGLETYTVLAMGLVFLGNRWRSLRIQVLDVQRDRRRGTLENIGFFLLQTALGAAVLLLVARSASVALLAYAAAAGVFGAVGFYNFRRALARLPAGPAAPVAQMIVRYGLPLGLLTICQSLQTFAERYALGYQLDYENVGRYVAAYQVCGFPFMMMNAVLTTLVLPIAFQRARDVTDPRQLWAADKLLLAGMGLYVGVGVLVIVGYAVSGQWLVRLLASKAYAVPTASLVVIATARMFMFAGLLQQMFFKVHQQTRFLLLYSAIGGTIAVGAAWVFVGSWGLHGAAVAALLTGVTYNILLLLAPGGMWTLLRRLRADLAHARSSVPGVTPEVSS